MGAMVAGVVVLPKRSTSLPFLSTRNLVKFLGRVSYSRGQGSLRNVPLDRSRAGNTAGAGHVLGLEPGEDLVHVRAVDFALKTSAHQALSVAHLLGKGEGDAVVDLRTLE